MAPRNLVPALLLRIGDDLAQPLVVVVRVSPRNRGLDQMDTVELHIEYDIHFPYATDCLVRVNPEVLVFRVPTVSRLEVDTVPQVCVDATTRRNDSPDIA